MWIQHDHIKKSFQPLLRNEGEYKVLATTSDNELILKTQLCFISCPILLYSYDINSFLLRFRENVPNFRQTILRKDILFTYEAKIHKHEKAVQQEGDACHSVVLYALSMWF
jgi:hypothetical protein